MEEEEEEERCRAVKKRNNDRRFSVNTEENCSQLLTSIKTRTCTREGNIVRTRLLRINGQEKGLLYPFFSRTPHTHARAHAFVCILTSKVNKLPN